MDRVNWVSMTALMIELSHSEISCTICRNLESSSLSSGMFLEPECFHGSLSISFRIMSREQRKMGRHSATMGSLLPGPWARPWSMLGARRGHVMPHTTCKCVRSWRRFQRMTPAPARSVTCDNHCLSLDIPSSLCTAAIATISQGNVGKHKLN